MKKKHYIYLLQPSPIHFAQTRKCFPPHQNFKKTQLTTSDQSPPLNTKKWPTTTNPMELVFLELKVQATIGLPLLVMNLTWFTKIAITTAFLGRLGELQLAGGALGFTFANVTGFSVLNGLCSAMEPICGQAHGARNFRLLHKTLLMSTLLLLLATLPIAFLWVNVDKILIHFGQQKDISHVAKDYLFYLLPDLVITSLLCPIKSYLSAQGVTLPIMFSSCLGLALHIPFNILLAKSRGLEGVSMAIWITDLVVVVSLVAYLLVKESGKGGHWKEGGWIEHCPYDWLRLLKLCGPCCLTTCLEWWCWEILVLLTGRLPDARQAVGVIAIVLNFDYLLYSVMLSLATCASIRVSNELGANQASPAYRSAYVSLAVSIISGFVGGLLTVGARGFWGGLFSRDKGIVRGVKKTMLLLALLEMVNFPVAVCGGIVRGTAKPWLSMYANLGGFYLLALPMAVFLAFKARFGLRGLLMGFLVGIAACLILFVVFILRVDWEAEADKAQKLTSNPQEDVTEGSHRIVEAVDGDKV